MGFILIYVTHENEDSARKIVDHLVSKKFIAGGNIFPISSIYWWKGKIEDISEYVSILKTKSENWEKVKNEVIKIHPYEVPAIIKFCVSANSEYEAWINDESR
ncbi:divalent-cation tolerance protein CutA [Candidatus Pacearchaeota archaeon]|nr:divalent-cation tolerance protein CutA [Candidatus Pacearchaeota archaeon]